MKRISLCGDMTEISHLVSPGNLQREQTEITSKYLHSKEEECTYQEYCLSHTFLLTDICVCADVRETVLM